MGKSLDNYEKLIKPSQRNLNKWQTSLKILKNPLYNIEDQIKEQISVFNLIKAYQNKSFLIKKNKKFPIELNLNFWGLNKSFLDKNYLLPNTTFIGEGQKELTLNEILNRLEKIYSQNIGYEISHLQDQKKIEFLKENIENFTHNNFSNIQRLEILRDAINLSLFDTYLSKNNLDSFLWKNNNEMEVILIKELIKYSDKNKISSINIGIDHQGILNTFVKVCNRPINKVFSIFNDSIIENSNDATYFQNLYRKFTKNDYKVGVKMIPIFSDIDIIYPIIIGKTKAEQDLKGNRVVSLMIHDDIFKCQKILNEINIMKKYMKNSFDGSIHIIKFNPYYKNNISIIKDHIFVSNIAKFYDSPVIYVKDNDLEALYKSAQIAFDYYNKFKTDVFIDISSYQSKWKNNFYINNDDELILNDRSLGNIYSKKLIKEGLINEDDIKNHLKSSKSVLKSDLNNNTNKTIPSLTSWLDSNTEQMKLKRCLKSKDPQINLNILISMLFYSLILPNICYFNYDIILELKKRKTRLIFGIMDWILAEMMIFLYILQKGTNIRFSPFNLKSGFLDQRNYIFYDKEKDEFFTSLNNFEQLKRGKIIIYPNFISLKSMLGFEYGYCSNSYETISILEIQFENLYPTFQKILNELTFNEKIAYLKYGLIFIIPYESGINGQGNLNIDTILRLSKEDSDAILLDAFENNDQNYILKNNIVVAYPTTPSNYFHLIKRHYDIKYNKPLFINISKDLMNHPWALSQEINFENSESFQSVIGENKICPKDVIRLIFCSGKIYYDLVKLRNEKNLEHIVSIVRIEQICPFPYDKIALEISKYKNADMMYVQEESKNKGFYNYIKPKILNFSLDNKVLKFCGRTERIKNNEFFDQFDSDYEYILHKAFVF